MWSTGKVVGEVTGHKSSKALRTYECTSEDQQRAAGRAISNLSPFQMETNKEEKNVPNLSLFQTVEEETCIENVLPLPSEPKV